MLAMLRKLIEWVWALTGWALEIVKRPRSPRFPT